MEGRSRARGRQKAGRLIAAISRNVARAADPRLSPVPKVSRPWGPQVSRSRACTSGERTLAHPSGPSPDAVQELV